VLNEHPLCLNGPLEFFLLNKELNIGVDDVRVPCVIVLFEDLFKEGLIDVQCESLSFFVTLLLE
jgi:hypothetical protein